MKNKEQRPLALDKQWLSSTQSAIHLQGYYQDSVSIDFKNPKSVDVVGSSKLMTATKPYMNIDVVITIPAEIGFDEKDILNHNYFDKRKLYVAAIASALQHKSSSAGTHIPPLIREGGVEFVYFQGDERKPMIQVQPLLKGGGNSINVRVYFSICPSVFKVSQLRADKNNVRPRKWMEKIERYKRENKKGGHLSLDPSTLKGTPYYNHAILEDMTFLPQYRFLSKTLERCPAARDCIILVLVWLTQRSLRFEMDTLNSHTASLLVAYLFHTRRIATSSTAMGAFLVVLKFMAETSFEDWAMDFSHQDLKQIDKKGGGDDGDGDVMNFAATLLFPIQSDNSNSNSNSVPYNILWRVTSSSISQIREDAFFTLNKFKSGDGEAFQEAFLRPKQFCSKYDMIFSIRIDDKGGESMKSHDDDDGMIPWQYVAQKARELLTIGLGDRVVQVHTCMKKLDGLDGSSSCSHSSHINEKERISIRLLVGLVFDPNRCYRRVDRGPSPDDEVAVEKFRQFWGDGCSLRRFNDGSIVEAVVWGEGDSGSKKGGLIYADALLKDICKYVLGRHLLSDVCSIQWSPITINKVLGIKNNPLLSSDPRLQEDSESLTSSAVEALDKLRGILTSSVKDFPLVIDNVMGACPSLRYTSFIPPIAHPLIDGCRVSLKRLQGSQISLNIAPLLIVGVLMTSGKWPTEYHAIQKIKTALYLRLSRLLHEQFRIKSIVHEGSLDIQYQGYLFRLKFIRDEDSSLIPAKICFSEPSIELGLHHHHIRGVQSRFPSFGDTVRLLSCWIAGNMLSGHLSHEVLELIVSSVYLKPTGARPPSSSFNGLLQVLQRIIDFDWKADALIIDYRLEGERNKTYSSIVTSQFQQRPATAAMYIVSIMDGRTYLFTEKTPEIAILPMIIHLARMTTFKAMKVWQLSTDDASQVCEEDLLISNHIRNICNVVLIVNKSITFSINKESKQKVGGIEKIIPDYLKGAPFSRLDVFANTAMQDTSIKSIQVSENTTPNPIQEDIIQRLRDQYGRVALFFWNSFKGREICVIWRPSLFMPKIGLNIMHMKNKITFSDEIPLVIPNTTSLVAEMIASSEGLLSDCLFI